MAEAAANIGGRLAQMAEENGKPVATLYASEVAIGADDDTRLDEMLNKLGYASGISLGGAIPVTVRKLSEAQVESVSLGGYTRILEYAATIPDEYLASLGVKGGELSLLGACIVQPVQLSGDLITAAWRIDGIGMGEPGPSSATTYYLTPMNGEAGLVAGKTVYGRLSYPMHHINCDVIGKLAPVGSLDLSTAFTITFSRPEIKFNYMTVYSDSGEAVCLRDKFAITELNDLRVALPLEAIPVQTNGVIHVISLANFQDTSVFSIIQYISQQEIVVADLKRGVSSIAGYRYPLNSITDISGTVSLTTYLPGIAVFTRLD